MKELLDKLQIRPNTAAERARGVAAARAVIQRVQEKAAETLEALYLPSDDPKRNPDADRNWADCSMKTRAALVLCKDATREPGDGDGKVFGVIFMQDRVDDPRKWEAEARKVDEEERRKNAIDVKVTDE